MKNYTLNIAELCQKGKFVLIKKGSKAPVGDAWQKGGSILETSQAYLNRGKSPEGKEVGAIGILCGPKSGGLLMLDHDGESCDRLLQEWGAELPPGPIVSSGRLGHFQQPLWVPEIYWEGIQTTKFKTGENGPDGKAELLELRWNGCQSLVLGEHTDPGKTYQWKDEQLPIPMAPIELIERMLKPQKERTPKDSQPLGDKERALSYLDSIDPTPLDWYTWRNCLFACHSAGIPESEVLNWSERSATHTERGFSDVWRHIKGNPGVGIGTLGYLAKLNGWKSPNSLESPKERGTQAVHKPEQSNPSDLSQEIKDSLGQTFEDFDICAALPLEISKPLIQLSERLNAPQGGMMAMLLPICASLLKIGTGVKLPGGTHQIEPPILWTCFYGESGNAKSPIQRLLLKGLNSLRQDANLRFELNRKEFEAELSKWEGQSKKERAGADPKPKAPSRRIYCLNSHTTEAVVLKQSLQPKDGFLIAVDELAGWFKSLNQYKSKGDDLEAWLSFYDGGGIEQARVTREDVYLDAVGFSVLGGIQPCKLKAAMGNLEEQDGLWARFSYLRIPTTRTPEISDEPDVDLSPIEDLYRELDRRFSQVIQLNPLAIPVWRDWVRWTDDLRLSEGHEAIRVLYPKLKARAARFALVLAAIYGEGEISKERLESAIAFTKWTLRQTLSIYDELGLADNPASDRITRFVAKFKDAGWIKPRTAQRSLKGAKADEARNFMAKLVELGFAESNGKGSTDSGYEILITLNSVDRSTKNPQLLPMLGSDCQPAKLTAVDKVDNLNPSEDSPLKSLSTCQPVSTEAVDSQNQYATGVTGNLSTCQPNLDSSKKVEPPSETEVIDRDDI
jgi:Protein of unknown function (DUF3987)/Bifunctional DNA primase/polymerase, N-terminal/Primase C terminal 2 (PriCT-2)